MAVIGASGLGHRLRITPMGLDDVDDIRRLGSDRDVFRFMPEVQQPFAAESWVEAMLSNPENYIRHIVRDRHTGEAMGFVFVGRRWNAELQMGYWLASSYWGRGYATEAAGAALLLFFAAARPQRIYAATMPDNLASRAVLRKLGFRPCPVDPQARVTPGMIDHVFG